jgi:acyl-CoA dehydrogenase
LPEFLCRQGVATAKLRKVLADWQAPSAAPLYAVFPAGLEDDHRVRSFVEFRRREYRPGARPLARGVGMYRAPVKELRFVLEELIVTDALRACPNLPTIRSRPPMPYSSEAARFAETVLEPLCKSGDREGARWSADGVTMPAGFKEPTSSSATAAGRRLRSKAEFGGQNVPAVLGTAVEELWAGANLAFKLCPMLTQGAIEAIQHFASPQQKQLFLPKMVSGAWTGTMNLTEPQAGSDLAQVRTRATPAGPNYRISRTEDLHHLRRARSRREHRAHGAGAHRRRAARRARHLAVHRAQVLGERDGSPGPRNDVNCASIEHKLGIHASPTCVMMYRRERRRARHLVGEPNRGLEYMFVMMNAARLSVGLEGYAQGERAFQQAVEWARTRVQGKPPGALAKIAGSASMGTNSSPAPIIGHPDVKRMLLGMKSTVEACRALALYAAFQLDLGAAHPDEALRAAAQARGDLLIPIVKGFCTESGIDIASVGIQVHGGMGYVEETGAAQTFRDARITAIYEGTTGIQSNDLIGRKVGRDRGAALLAFLGRDAVDARGALSALIRRDAGARRGARRGRPAAPIDRCAARGARQLADRAMAVSVPFLKLCGLTIGGWLMARAAASAANRLAGGAADGEFLAAKLASAQFYAAHVLAQVLTLEHIVTRGGESVTETDSALI